ncbi:hypothetical protein ESCO_001948 [Escovopsis weberi]|uniref:Uncharacterized protein n=1 Tax=Escovopsis weberi TaxID=150374 RepID=A0A0M8N8B7_ESCWE|nr:hypothetical protein ESCO_001948 [Escovopsis weberi]
MSHAVSEPAVEPETGAGHDDVRLVVHDFLSSELPADGLMAAVDDFFHSEASMRLAAEAMSTGVLSAISQSPQLWTRSLHAYNSAAAELVKTFKARKRSSQSEGVLATCRVLQMFRFRTSTQIIRRWPHSYKSPKSPADKILDIIEDIIDILGNVDHLRACRHAEDVERFRAIIIAGCQQLEARLHSLEQDADLNTRTFDYTATGLPLPPPRDAAELGTLYASGLYWAAHLILQATAKLAGPFSAEAPSHSGLPPATAASATTLALSPALVAHRSLLAEDSPPSPRLHHQGRVRFWDGSKDSLLAEPEPGTFASKIAHAAHLLLTCASAGASGSASTADSHGFDDAAALFTIAMAVHFFASGMGEPSGAEAQMLFDLLGTPSLSALVMRFLARLQGGAVQPAAPAAAQKRDNLWLFLVLN